MVEIRSMIEVMEISMFRARAYGERSIMELKLRLGFVEIAGLGRLSEYNVATQKYSYHV